VSVMRTVWRIPHCPRLRARRSRQRSGSAQCELSLRLGFRSNNEVESVARWLVTLPASGWVAGCGESGPGIWQALTPSSPGGQDDSRGTGGTRPRLQPPNRDKSWQILTRSFFFELWGALSYWHADTGYFRRSAKLAGRRDLRRRPIVSITPYFTNSYDIANKTFIAGPKVALQSTGHRCRNIQSAVSLNWRRRVTKQSTWQRTRRSTEWLSNN
jgi:hypothetical protein